MNGNLPNWQGAAGAYSRAYRILERMAQSGHVRRVKRGRNYVCSVSQEMSDFIAALNSGNENDVKAYILRNIDNGQQADF